MSSCIAGTKMYLPRDESNFAFALALVILDKLKEADKKNSRYENNHLNNFDIFPQFWWPCHEQERQGQGEIERGCTSTTQV